MMALWWWWTTDGKLIDSKNVDIAVTSKRKLQTTAGKMIFGKFDERTRVGERIEPKAETGKPERCARRHSQSLWNPLLIRNPSDPSQPKMGNSGSGKSVQNDLCS